MPSMPLLGCAGYAQGKRAIGGETMPPAQKIRTIDTHSHILADATIKLLQKEIPKLGLKLTPYDNENSVVEVAGTPYRPFPRGGHNIEARFADMAAAEVDMHLLSVSPH